MKFIDCEVKNMLYIRNKLWVVELMQSIIDLS